MATTSKIQSIGKVREYDYQGKHKRGTLLTMENGDIGECSQEKADAFKVGQELVYNLKENPPYDSKMYLETPKSGGGKGNRPKEDPKVTIASIAAGYTKDLIVAGKIELKDFANTADIIFNWVNKHADNKPVQTPQAPQTTPVAQPSEPEYISETEAKELHDKYHKKGFNDEAYKAHLEKNYKVSTATKLTKIQAEDFTKYLSTIEDLPLP